VKLETTAETLPAGQKRSRSQSDPDMTLDLAGSGAAGPVAAREDLASARIVHLKLEKLNSVQEAAGGQCQGGFGAGTLLQTCNGAANNDDKEGADEDNYIVID
jgi:hypothetical protein